MVDDYPFIVQDDKNFNIGLDPTTHITLSIKDIQFIINKYNEYIKNARYPNRTGDDEQDEYICPNCNHIVGYLDDWNSENPNYCSKCGQKLNWNDAFKNGKVVEIHDNF